MADAWSLEVKGFYQRAQSHPGHAPPLAAPIERTVQCALCPIIEVPQTVIISYYSVVIVVTTEFGIEFLKELCLWFMTVFTAPFLHIHQGGPILLSGWAPLDNRLTPAAETPAKLKSQKFKGTVFSPVQRTKPYQVRLLFGKLQSILAKSFTQDFVKSLSIRLVLEGAYEIVRIPTQVDRSTAMDCDDFLSRPEHNGDRYLPVSVILFPLVAFQS